MATNNSIEAYNSLASDVNKKKSDVTDETVQGIASEKLPELTLDMKDEEIITLTKKWETLWNDSPKKSEWIKKYEENEKYWLGNQHDLPKADKSRPNVDNLIFESVETQLPQITRRNPEPLITLDASVTHSPESDKYIEVVKNRLADLADKNKLRLKLKKACRHWSIYLLGVAKYGWDLDRNIPVVRIVRPQKILLDPDATIDEDGYTGSRIGEVRKMEADTLLKIIGDGKDTPEGDPQAPVSKAKKAIDDLVKDDKGTEIQFTEWWTPEYMCWVLGDTVLMKKKNPHWNYDKQEIPSPLDMSSPGVQVDDYGETTTEPVDIPGLNHFSVPDMPYSFLTVFNLGDQPMDNTSLIGQNLANQDLINKRNRQIDKNADRMNGGLVVSMARAGLTKEESKGVTDALRKGGVVVIPDGSPRDAVDDFAPSALPADVYNQLADTRSRLRDIFGTRGSSAAGLASEQTVRGKILNKATDTDRVGGGVSEYLEQFADDIYNWLLQLLYVYDESFQVQPGMPQPPKLVVSVKEGSLLPKDSTSIANQAIELGIAGKMALVDMYKRLEYPNPEEIAANVWLEINAPQILYKDNPLVQEVFMMQQQAAAAAAQAEGLRVKGESEQDMEKGRVAHEQGLEKEVMKGTMKMQGDAQRSILSAVPQNLPV